MFAHRPLIATRLATLALAAAVTTGCQNRMSAGDEQAGPMDVGGDKSTACTPHKGRGSATYGSDRLQNPSDGDLINLTVELVGKDNVEVIDGWLVPIPTKLLIGTSSHWPPPADTVRRTAWDEREPLDGAVLAPGAEANLVLQLKRPDPASNSSFDMVNITYASAGQTYTNHSTMEVLLYERCR